MRDNLQFLCDLPIYKDEQPYELYGFPEKESDKQTNCNMETRTVTVLNVRDMAEALDIEEHGFKFIQHASNCDLEPTHFEVVGGDQRELMAYLDESIELVRSELHATKVICFDWRVSR